MEHRKLGGIYWCLNAMDLMNKLEGVNCDEIVQHVKTCQQDSGGFSPAEKHDAELLYTCSAIQVFLCFCLVYVFSFTAFNV